MSIYVTDAADIARAEGITNIKEWDGWKNRAASQGGFTTLMGVVIHHTASPVSWRGDKDWNYTLTNTDNAPEYLAGIDPDGRLNLLCAGGANSSGKGGPLTLSTGTVPQTGANYRLIAVCFGNTGDGTEPYTAAAIDTGVRFVAGLCRRFNWDTGAITCHKEWCGPGTICPGRKIDPYGPWEQGGDWGPQQGRIDQFRGLVFDHLCGTPPDPNGDDELNQDQANELHATYLIVSDLQTRVGVLEDRWTQSAANEAHATYQTSDWTWQTVQQVNPAEAHAVTTPRPPPPP